jgi:hypothetical protein
MVNKMNNLLSPQLIEHKTDHDYKTLKIQVLAYDGHKKVVALNRWTNVNS